MLHQHLMSRWAAACVDGYEELHARDAVILSAGRPRFFDGSHEERVSPDPTIKKNIRINSASRQLILRDLNLIGSAASGMELSASHERDWDLPR
jgi:hypothetical protein